MTEQPNRGDASAALRGVARQRDLLAARLEPPLWYSGGQALALLVLFVAPGVSQWPGQELSRSVVVLAIVAAVVGLSLLDARFAQAVGVKLGSDRHRAYASSRRATLRAGTITLVAALLTWVVALVISAVAALILGVILAFVVARARQGILAAVREDIRAGRTGTR
ncbi:MAG TPA: hypothetical protein VN522_12495 [Solirubrobacterales bacterium]|nr:hypothetical protein [Solirubrobacterales bacterium]